MIANKKAPTVLDLTEQRLSEGNGKRQSINLEQLKGSIFMLFHKS